MKRILFVSHDASRTGAPIVLLNFLEWLKAEQRVEIVILVKIPGEMEASFAALAPTFVPEPPSRLQRRFKRIVSKVITIKEGHVLPAALLRQSFDLLYMNTVTCLDLTPQLIAAFNCPAICHVHENEFTLQRYNRPYMVPELLRCITHFIAVSTSTLENLVQNYGIPRDKLSLVYEFVPISSKPDLTKEVVRKELGFTDEFIVGGSGLASWRKGIDWFVQLGAVLNHLRPGNRIKLMWVGEATEEFMCQFNYEAPRLGVEGKIIFTGKKTAPHNYFQLFDLFALTSREDPFPLVALEAATLHIPILCFSDSGGIPEVIQSGNNGVIVPYGDVEAMAVQILALMDQNDFRVNMGNASRELVKQYDSAIAGNQLLAIIDRFAAP